jgi:hypothetical protein
MPTMMERQETDKTASLTPHHHRHPSRLVRKFHVCNSELQRVLSTKDLQDLDVVRCRGWWRLVGLKNRSGVIGRVVFARINDWFYDPGFSVIPKLFLFLLFTSNFDYLHRSWKEMLYIGTSLSHKGVSIVFRKWVTRSQTLKLSP